MIVTVMAVAATKSTVAQNGGHHRVGDEPAVLLPDVLEPVAGQPGHDQQAEPVTAAAAVTTKTVATPVSTTTILDRPSATLNPM
jgi:hypothetical protein